jgi:hypothetical protein
MKHLVPVLALTFLAAATVARAQTPSTLVVAADRGLETMTLVKSTDGKAVVRFGRAAGAGRADAAELLMVRVGDRVGKAGATVTTIAPGRVVLEEVTTAPDGKPLRAQIVIRDGETGGKTFLRHPDLDAPVGLRPEILEPAAPASNGKKTPQPRQ